VSSEGSKPEQPRNTLYRQATKSQRRLTPARRLLYRIGAPLALAIVRFWWWTCRRIRVLHDERLDRALEDSASLIPCYWHQQLLFCVPYLLTKRARGLKPGFLISPSVDGEAPAIVARRLGAHVIRGSASYTGARALRDFYVALAKEQISPLITPDGPHGPAFVFKSGALLLSQLSGKPVVPIAYAASRAWMLRTWDRFVIPLPFARIVVAVGEPLTVPRVVKPEELERLQTEMARTLEELFVEAREALGRRKVPRKESGVSDQG